MDRPDRPADRIFFFEEYKESNETVRVSKATSVIPGTRFVPPVVTAWEEREVPAPGLSTVMVSEVWYEGGKIIAYKQALSRANRTPLFETYQQALAAQNTVSPNSSGLMRSWELYKGWGEPGFSFWVTPEAYMKNAVSDDYALDFEVISGPEDV